VKRLCLFKVREHSEVWMPAPTRAAVLKIKAVPCVGWYLLVVAWKASCADSC
jgi:hypothetical protein